MNRRLLLGTAAVAVVAGAGVGWWRRGRAPAGEAAATDRIEKSFERPGGGSLVLSAYAGKPLVVNFWATWCAPCVREMPMLDAFAKEHAARGWQVVGLAIDKLELVKQFLAKTPVSYPIGVAGPEALQWIRELGNTGGGLPFTIVYDRDGNDTHRKLGELKPEDLASWVSTTK